MVDGGEDRRADPVESGADVSWETYDDFIRELVDDTSRPAGRRYAVEYLAEIARREARMRKQAQDEAAELRAAAKV